MGIITVLLLFLAAIGWLLYLRERNRRQAAQIAIIRWQKLIAEWQQAGEIWQESARMWKESSSKLLADATVKYQPSKESVTDGQPDDLGEDEGLVN